MFAARIILQAGSISSLSPWPFNPYMYINLHNKNLMENCTKNKINAPFFWTKEYIFLRRFNIFTAFIVEKPALLLKADMTFMKLWIL